MCAYMEVASVCACVGFCAGCLGNYLRRATYMLRTTASAVIRAAWVAWAYWHQGMVYGRGCYNVVGQVVQWDRSHRMICI